MTVGLPTVKEIETDFFLRVCLFVYRLYLLTFSVCYGLLVVLFRVYERISACYLASILI